MKALCVDDEAILLKVLQRSVEASPDINETFCFSSARKALEFAKEHPVDIAFLDIQINQMNGLELAEKLLAQYPTLPVIFCTGYDQYAREAFNVHAFGYLNKPIYPEDVQEQIDRIKSIYKDVEQEQKLKVECFGNFEVYANGKQLMFKRKKSKELLAYLIDRKGAFVSPGQISSALWEEELDVDKMKNYFYQVLHHLKVVLKEAGFEKIILNSAEGYAVDKSLLDCDYYRYLDNDPSVQNAFNGEYMFQYSWAEETCGLLNW